jgi:hypothetical protein
MAEQPLANRTKSGKKVIRKTMGRQKKFETFQTFNCPQIETMLEKDGRGRGGGEKEKVERSMNRQ